MARTVGKSYTKPAATAGKNNTSGKPAATAGKDCTDKK